MDIKLGKLFWEITGDTSKLVTELAKAQQKTNETGTSLQKIGGKLSLFITAPLLGIGAAALKSAADLEQQRVAFVTMLKSASKAEALLKDIENFAATTPFQMPQLIEGSKRLLAFGVSAGNVVDTMRMLGNAASGNAGILDRLVLAYGKLRAKGRASMEELNMFTEAGVPIIKELEKQYGVTGTELFKLITTGKVGFNDVNKAITSLTTGSGQFAGLIEKQSRTFSGALSTFKDNLSIAGRTLVEGFLPPLTDMLVKGTKLVAGFSSLDDGTKRLIITAAALLALLGPTAAAMGTLIKVSTQLSTIWTALGTKIIPALITKGLPALIALLTGPVGIVLAIVAVATALGYVIKTIADVKKQKLEAQFEGLASNLGITAKVAAQVATEFNKAYKAGANIVDVVDLQAQKYNLTRDQIFQIVSGQANISEEMRTQLELVKKSIAEQRRLYEEAALDAEVRRVGVLQAQKNLILLRQQKVEAAAMAQIETSRQGLVQKIGYYQGLQSKGIITQLDFLKKAYDIRQQTIDSLIEEGEKAGGLSKEQQAYVQGLIRLNGGLAVTISDLEKAQADIAAAADKAEQDRLDAIEKQKQAEIDLEVRRNKAIEQWNALQMTETQKRLDEIDWQVLAFQDAGIDAVEVEKWKQEQIDKLQEEQHLKEVDRLRQLREARLETFQTIYGFASNLDSALTMFGNNEIERITQINEREIAAMEASGATEKEIAARKEELEENLDKKKKELEIKAFNRRKALNLAQVVIDTAAAIVRFLADPGGVAGVALSVAAGITGAMQAAAIATQPVPALAEGGIALPMPGGRTVRVAEAGSAEAVIPLNDKGKEFIGEALGPTRETRQVATIPVSFAIDRFKEIAVGIINVALKNGEVVVDARKLTNLQAAVGGAR